MLEKNTVLVAPLNWGLGHATRCIPIITELLQQNCHVIIAGDTPSIDLIKEEFPQLTYFICPSPEPVYQKGKHQVLAMLKFLPGFIRAIKQEQKWIQSKAEQLKPDLIISDNRYGMFHPNIKSIFIGHQLTILLPRPFSIFQKLINRIQHRTIKKFSTCWIPDFSNSLLSGKLSQRKRADHFYQYVGPLSRFSKPKDNSSTSSVYITLLLSGPEPQRTILEKILLQQNSNLTNKQIVLVRGLYGREIPLHNIGEHVQVFQNRNAKDLQELLQSSKIIVSRAGYSSIMDLVSLGKKAILIPTPGQTEQEYLGHYLHKKFGFVTAQQKYLSLQNAIAELHNLHYNPKEINPEFVPILKKIVQDVSSINS